MMNTNFPKISRTGWVGLAGAALSLSSGAGLGSASAQFGGQPGGGQGQAQGQGGGQVVELRYQVPPELTAQVQESQTLTLSGQASDGWGNNQPLQQTFSGTVAYRLQVMQTDNGLPTQAKVDFAPGLMFNISDGQNPPQQQPLPFAGKTFTLTRTAGGGGMGPNGNAPGSSFPGQQPPPNNGGFGQPAAPTSPIRVEPANTMDAESESFLHELMEFGWRDIVPGRAVRVGETWNPSGENYTRGLGLDPGGSVQITAQLASVGNANGRPTAEINLRLQINGAFDGLPMQGIQQGRATVDVATGIVVNAQLAGEWPLQVQGPQGSINGKTSWQINRQVTNLQGGGSAGNANNGVGQEKNFQERRGAMESTHETMINDIRGEGARETDDSAEESVRETDLRGNSQQNTGSQGSGMSVNGQSAPGFDGTFVNDTLQLTLIEGQPRRIEIRRGDLLTQGRLTGNRNVSMSAGENGMTFEITFQGFFTHDGKEYPFSAEQLTADQIKFTTGKTTYDLTRLPTEAAVEESANPFD